MEKEESDQIDLDKWKTALSKIKDIDMMAYAGDIEGESAVIQKVVNAVCTLLPPDLKYGVSHVQSLKRLCEVSSNLSLLF